MIGIYKVKKILHTNRTKILPFVIALVMALTLLPFDARPVRAAAVTASISVGKSAGPLVLNPATNKIYVIDRNSNQVIVIDGTTNATTKIDVGTAPVALAVNQNTNKIYVANNSSNDVTIIDGLSCKTTTVKVGDRPGSVAVNSITNKIYVANSGSDDVTVIDASNNVPVRVGAGDHPQLVTVNPITNKVYVANYLSSDVTVIDGASNKTVTVKTLPFPHNIAINSITNRIYVVGATYATIIDGFTNNTTTIQPGLDTISAAVAVNPTTNMIYISSDFGHGKVIAINGETNSIAVISVGSFPSCLVVNQGANILYVVNSASSDVSIINCNTGATTIIKTDEGPGPAIVNPVTQKIYVAHYNSGTVTVIDENSPTTPPFINNGSLPFGTEGVAYKIAMTASGGTAPYSWAASDLPGGLDINPSSGEIQGLPTSSGRFTIHVTVTDQTSQSAAKDLNLIINPGTGRQPANIILQIGCKTMQVNGISQDIDPGYDTAPVIVNGRTFVPIGAIIQELGGSTAWSPSDQAVSVYLNGETIGLKIGEFDGTINSTPRPLSAAPFISSTGRTMVPLSFIIENLGLKVEWNATTQNITIT